MAENSWLLRVAADVEKLKRDMYEGDGPNNPAMTARMLLVEDTVSKLASNSKWIVRLLVATFLAVIGGLFEKGMH